MLDLEKFFTTLNLEDGEKVNLAAFQLFREASRWYIGLSQRETQPVTWARFVNRFEEEYFPTMWKEKKYDEFMALWQGSMSVSEYRTKFLQLLRFAKGIFLEESMLKRKFENGMRDNIRVQMSMNQTHTVVECADLAMRFERHVNEIRERNQ